MDGGNRRVAVPSKIFVSTVLDPKEAEDERLERAEKAIAQLISDSGSEKEVHDNLTKYSSKGSSQNEDVCLGLLYKILTNSNEPKLCQQYLRDLNMISRDGNKLPVERVNFIILEKFHKLLDSARVQVIFFVRESVRSGVAMADMLCFSLMRQIAGGDVSPKNLWLAEQVLNTFAENRAWFLSFPVLLQTAVYTFLRIIVDHQGPRFVALRQREVEFTAGIIKDKFDVVASIGRDLVRLLQGVARIPEFAAIWSDILHNPSALSPSFTGVTQLMRTRTRRTFIACRLTPEMEKKLLFLTSNVKFGQQKRYQDWFQRTYLGTPESQSLRCDLIRYICCIIHPPNEVLCSDIIPRWAVIGWLLTTCTSNVDASNAKLSLFYDWLLFDPESDNIMNIEPAILVMYHSIRPHPPITATLLDFLCRIMKNFSLPLADKVRGGIHNALRAITSKRVLPSLSPLFDNPKLDEELRGMVRENFGEFCSVKAEVGGGGSSSANNLIPQGFAALSHPSSAATTASSSHSSSSLANIHQIPSNASLQPTNQHHQPIKHEAEDDDDEAMDSREQKWSESSDIPEGTFSEDEDEKETSPTDAVSMEEPTDSPHPQKLQQVQQQPPPPPPSSSSTSSLSKSTSKTDLVGKLATSTTTPSSSSSTPHFRLDMVQLKAKNARLHEQTRRRMTPIDIEPFLAQVENVNLKEKILAYNAADDEEELCGIMEGIVQEILADDEFADAEVAAPIAAILCQLLIEVFDSDIFPAEELTEEAMISSIESPLFVIFRVLQSMAEEDPSRNTLLVLLTEMRKRQRRVGYLMLYFLKVDKSQDGSGREDGKMAPYRDFVKAMIESGSGGVGIVDNSGNDGEEDGHPTDLCSCLLSDLRCCVDDDVRVFCVLLPEIFAQFTSVALGSADLTHLVVSSIDGAQLQDIVCHVFLGHLTMFRKDTLMNVLNASLEWESIEQLFLWQIIGAHDCVSVEHALPLMPKLEFRSHAEALTALLLLLKRESPTPDLLRHVLSREQKDADSFVISVLRHWVAEHEEKLASLVQQQIARSHSGGGGGGSGGGNGSSGGGNGHSNSSPRKKQNGKAGNGLANAEPPIELILAHLEHLRRTCPLNLNTFFFRDSMQSALSQVQQACTETQKMHYSDLLSLADDFEDSRVTRNLRHVAARRANQAAAHSGSSSSSSNATASGRHSQNTANSSERRGQKRDRAGGKSGRSQASSSSSSLKDNYGENDNSDDSDNDNNDDSSSSSSSSDSEDERSSKTLPPRKRNPPPLPDKINLF